MKYLSFIFIFTLITVVACKSQTESSTDEETGYKYFGEKIEKIDAVSFSDLMVALESQDSVFTQVKADVEAVCQTKGCWMNLVDGKSETEGDASLFVKFKDYGFFMPKDIAGKTVIVRGYAYKEITSVDELKHYAEDEGKSQEEIDQITEAVEELKFMADGVILL